MSIITDKLQAFRNWRRSRNPELVKLDAYEELAGVELRLREFPKSLPLLERAIELCEITEQDLKRKDYIERLKQMNTDGSSEKHESLPPRIKKMIDAMDGEQKALLEKARALVKETGRTSVPFLQRKLGTTFNEAANLSEILQALEGK